MAEFVEALDAALSAAYRLPGIRRPITHRQGLKARMNQILKAHGGDRRAAAKSAGIPYSTWGHMLSGKRSGKTFHVSAKNQARLETAYGRQIGGPALVRAIDRDGTPDEVLIWAVVVADPKRSRYINRGRGPDHPPGAGDGWRKFRAEIGAEGTRQVALAWAAGGGVDGAAVLVDVVARQYGTEFAFEGDHVEVEW